MGIEWEARGQRRTKGEKTRTIEAGRDEEEGRKDGNERERSG